MSEKSSVQYIESSNGLSTVRTSTVGEFTQFSIENEVLPPEKKDGEATAFVIFLKWLVALLLFGFMFVAVLTSKISFLMIGEHYRQVRNEAKGLTNNSAIARLHQRRGYSNESIFIILVLILLIPQSISLIMSAWTAMNRQKGIPWPSTSAILWILVGSVVEVAALCYLTIVVLTVMDVKADVMLLLLNCVFLVPSLTQLFRSDFCSNKGRPFMFAIATICQVSGLVMLVYTIDGLYGKVGVPLSIFLLSASWSPKMRKLQTQPRKTLTEESTVNAEDVLSDFQTLSDYTIQQNLSKSNINYRAQLKATVMSNFIKVLITPFVAALFGKFFNVVDLTFLKSGFDFLNMSNPVMSDFLAQIFTGFCGYCLGLLACTMRMQRIGFALPLILATPVAMAMTKVNWMCSIHKEVNLQCRSTGELWYTLVAGTLLCIGEFLCSGYYIWKNPGFIMADSLMIFRFPSYNAVFLEQYLMLNRRNSAMDKDHKTQSRMARDAALFVCTTMYHELEHEMEQLLHSLGNLDRNRHRVGRHLECHVFFDGCLEGENLNEYVLRLCSLLEKTIRVRVGHAVKMRTPYGMQLRWTMPGGTGFYLHMKDNNKVKNKKRWSQIMYMSYVLDHRQKVLGVQDDQSFILTTDADVQFTHDSVEALLDVLVQDPRVGACCGRTHPMGTGPLVWYQIFDYAIGHWLLKVANHIFGSVLCCPGCFSVFRTKAIREIIPIYSTNVNRAFEFLTKDMGEDRWMCTLMVQKGWRLAYSAAAEDSTFCPDTFDEFYKQRRRWMPSSLANQALLVSEWKVTVLANEHVGSFFMTFQVFLMASTIIGPSTVILVITGGMVMSGNILGGSEVSTVIVLCLVTVAYAVVCLYASRQVQLNIAKVLTLIFAIVMCSVTIGVAEQIGKELRDRGSCNRHNSTAINACTLEQLALPAGISTLYLAGLTGIFVMTAILHPREWYCVLNGIWYLLCLPSGYLLLTVYSVVNLTDRSWGTRENTTRKEDNGMEIVQKYLMLIWERLVNYCCACLEPAVEEEEQNKKSSEKKGKKKRKSWKKRLLAIKNFHKRARHTEEEKVKDLKGINLEETNTAESSNVVKARVVSASVSSSDNNAVEVENNFDQQGAPVRRGSLVKVVMPKVDEDGNDYPPPPPPRHEKARRGFKAKSPLPPVPEEEMRPFPPPHYADLPLEPPPSVPPRVTSISDDEDDGSQATISLSTMEKMTSSKQNKSKERSTDSLSFDSDTTSQGGRSTFRYEMTLENMTMPIENWLEGDMRAYIDKLKEEGYDNPSFLPGLSDKDLQDLGIKIRGHRYKLLREIKRIPRIEIEQGIPDNVYEWLDDLSLLQYWPNFEANLYTEPEDLEDLTSLPNKEALGELLNIRKPAHLNRLWMGVSKLQYVEQGLMQIRSIRREIDRLQPYSLEYDNGDQGLEYDFWEGLRQVRLMPEASTFTAGNIEDLKRKLTDFRNTTLITFTICNALWLLIIMTLVRHENLKILGVDVVGLAFLTVYGFIIGVQFVAMVIHRSLTFLHILARAPWTCGTGENSPRARIDRSSSSLSVARGRFGSNTTLISTLPLASVERLNSASSEHDGPAIIMTSDGEVPVFAEYNGVTSDQQLSDESIETVSVVSNASVPVAQISQQSLHGHLFPRVIDQYRWERAVSLPSGLNREPQASTGLHFRHGSLDQLRFPSGGDNRL